MSFSQRTRPEAYVYHLVVGILLMISAGVLMFALQSGRIATGLLAIAFGVGAALTLDEFALWFYLDDVYWSEEGRSSIDATIMALLAAGLILVGASPYGTEEEKAATDSDVLSSIVIAFHVVWVFLTLLKGKILFGLVSVFVPLIGIVGAIRLATPSSPWARWFYRAGEGKSWLVRWLCRKGEKKMATAKERYRVGWPVRFERWFQDLVGGAPHLPSPLGASHEATNRSEDVSSRTLDRRQSDDEHAVWAWKPACPCRTGRVAESGPRHRSPAIGRSREEYASTVRSSASSDSTVSLDRASKPDVLPVRKTIRP